LKVLLISATEKEINPILQKMENVRKSGHWQYLGNIGKLDVEIIIGGVGIPSTVFRLTQQLTREKYDLVINPGIAGTFKEGIRIGSVVNVVSEQFGDLGIDDNGEFKTLFDMGYLDKNASPFTNGKIQNNFDKFNYKILSAIPLANSITVNKTSGEENDIEKKLTKFQPDVESMEGAAVFYVCQQMNVPVIQLRAISNKVEPRNTKNWNIPQALNSLSDHVKFLLSEIEAKL
jgi:futalosine hydrolase